MLQLDGSVDVSILLVMYILRGDVKITTVAKVSISVSVFTKLQNDYSSFPNETCSILHILTGNYTLRLQRETVY
jgi:hypothetical protein